MRRPSPHPRRSVSGWLPALVLAAVAAAPALQAQSVVRGAPGETIRTAGGMVVSEHPEASRAG
ncbi:MAG: hypothetical protein RLN75_06910, partial [Longimicrobiales bacterium]